MRLSLTITMTALTGCVVPVQTQCPGAHGDALCQAKGGSSSACMAGDWICSGTSIPCGCDFRSGGVPVVLPTVAPTPSLRTSKTIAPVVTMSTAPPVQSATTRRSTAAPTAGLTTAPVFLPTPTACGSTPSRPLFLWAEWPSLDSPSEVASYFSKLLKFIAGNCGNFIVSRLILRVTNPTLDGLWTIGTESSFYSQFLTRLPAGIELHIYPYLFDANARASWSNSGQPPLEAVFKFAEAWNTLLVSVGSGNRISGIVVDLEEKAGFATELASVPLYKTQYGIDAFGMAIGYDSTGLMNTYPFVDDFYLEMYDFYVNNAPQLTLVQADAPGSENQPVQFLSVLTKDVLGPYVSKYSNPKAHFMWSIQDKSASDCLYPLGVGCGSSNDFGAGWTAPAFSRFLTELEAKYPVFAGRSHGLFQFSFVPTSWV